MLGRSLALLAALGPAGACAPAENPPARPPDVVLVSIDSLRADHLGCYGYERPTSPRIDELAAGGVRFANAVSSTSWTLPSHASLFTGLPDSVHGVDRSSRALAPSRTTLAERLAEAGYRTAGFWSGPYLHPLFGLSQGFDEYVGCTAHEYFGATEERFKGGAPRDQGEANHLSHEDVTSPRVLEAVTAWLEERGNDERPFFLFVHLWDVHYDFIPPPPYDTLFDPDYEGPIDGRGLSEDRAWLQDLSERDVEHLRALYDGEIAWTDRHVGELIDRVSARSKDTIVVVTSDHGEEFFEHGKFGHRKTLFEESIRVPLVLRAPGRLPAGTVIEEPVSLLDVAPTLLDLVGAPPLPDTYGQSLVPLLEGSATEWDPVTISELRLLRRDEEWIALRTPEWKLLLERSTGRTLKAWNLAADPAEARDLVEDGVRIPGELRALADETLDGLARLAERHADAASSDAEMTPEVTEDLQHLGYLGDEDEGASEREDE